MVTCLKLAGQERNEAEKNVLQSDYPSGSLPSRLNRQTHAKKDFKAQTESVFT